MKLFFFHLQTTGIDFLNCTWENLSSTNTESLKLMPGLIKESPWEFRL